MLKELFPGIFKLKEKEISEIWTDCLFVLDTNVLISLLRFSDSTRKIYFDTFNVIKDKIYVPYQVACEFATNYYSVISEQLLSYKNVEKFVSSIKIDLKNKILLDDRHPYINEKTIEKFTDLLNQINKESQLQHDKLKKYYAGEELLNEINELLSENIGVPYEEEEIKEITKNGEFRVKNKLPPGYKDEDKSGINPSSKFDKKLGDYVIWSDILKISKQKNKNVIFLSFDEKSDWTLTINGEKKGLHPILIDEFKKHTQKAIIKYHPKRFLELAKSKGINRDITPESIEETKKLAEDDQLIYKRYILNSSDMLRDSTHDYIEDLLMKSNSSPINFPKEWKTFSDKEKGDYRKNINEILKKIL